MVDDAPPVALPSFLTTAMLLLVGVMIHYSLTYSLHMHTIYAHVQYSVSHNFSNQFKQCYTRSLTSLIIALKSLVTTIVACTVALLS